MPTNLWSRCLIVFMVLLMGSCSPPVTPLSTSLTKPVDSAPPEMTTPSGPAPVEEDSAFPILDVSERQRTGIATLAQSMLNSADYIPEDQYDRLSGLILVANALYPNNYFDNRIRDVSKGEDYANKIRPLLAHLDGLTSAEKVDLINQTVQDYRLLPGDDGAALVLLVIGFPMVSYDPSRGITELKIPINELQEVKLAGSYQDLIDLKAYTLNHQTLMEEEAEPRVLSAVIEPSEMFGFHQQLKLELDGTLLAWSEIMFELGSFIDDSGDRLFGHFVHVSGLSPADAAMSLRPWIPSAEGRQLLTPGAYGGPEPQLLSPISDGEMATTMEARAREIVQRRVDSGDLTQKTADAIFQRFEDEPALASLHPVVKAALQVASSFNSLGGDRLVDSVLGQNHSQMPIVIYFRGDPELSEMLNGNLPSAELGALIGQVQDSRAPNGYTSVLVLNDKYKSGEEPLEVASLWMIHQLLIHDRWDPGQWNSLGEEVLGNLVDTLMWSELVHRDPGLLDMNTPDVQFYNLQLMSLLNSQHPDRLRNFEVGVLSEQTPPSYDALPGNNLGEAMRGFVGFQDYLYRNRIGANPDMALSPLSYGSENTRHVLISMFGDNPEMVREITSLDLDEDGYPEMSENFIRFLDRNLHRVYPNEEALELARLMKLEIQSGEQ